jgi:uncharacterized protein (TIGR03067 family)
VLLGFCLLCGVVGRLWGPPHGGSSPGDPATLEGEWVSEKGPYLDRYRVIVFQGDRMTRRLVEPDETTGIEEVLDEDVCQFETDPTSEPKQITWRIEKGGRVRTMRGIYRLEGDELEIRYNFVEEMDGLQSDAVKSIRPTSFETKDVGFSTERYKRTRDSGDSKGDRPSAVPKKSISPARKLPEGQGRLGAFEEHPPQIAEAISQGKVVWLLEGCRTGTGNADGREKHALYVVLSGERLERVILKQHSPRSQTTEDALGVKGSVDWWAEYPAGDKNRSYAVLAGRPCCAGRLCRP